MDSGFYKNLSLLTRKIHQFIEIVISRDVNAFVVSFANCKFCRVKVRLIFSQEAMQTLHYLNQKRITILNCTSMHYLPTYFYNH